MQVFVVGPPASFLLLAPLSGAWPVSDCGRVPLAVAYSGLVQGRVPQVVGHGKDLAAFKERFGEQTIQGGSAAREKGRA